MRTAVLVLLLALSSCMTFRPPTSILQVIDAAPAGAVRVGTMLPIWVEERSGNCASPPREVVLRAEKWGADWIVADVKHETYANGKTLCIAHAYASGSAS